MNTATSGFQLHIRWMIRSDMPEVLAIEGASFKAPWSEENFLEVLRSRNCIGMVAEPRRDNWPSGVDAPVQAFMVYELGEKALNVLNFAVDPACRRLGVGRSLVAKLKSKLSGHRRDRVVVTVRESNLPAQLFFRGQGFSCVRVERGHYQDAGEDGYRMVYRRPVERP